MTLLSGKSSSGHSSVSHRIIHSIVTILNRFITLLPLVPTGHQVEVPVTPHGLSLAVLQLTSCWGASSHTSNLFHIIHVIAGLHTISVCLHLLQPLYSPLILRIQCQSSAVMLHCLLLLPLPHPGQQVSQLLVQGGSTGVHQLTGEQFHRPLRGPLPVQELHQQVHSRKMAGPCCFLQQRLSPRT